MPGKIKDGEKEHVTKEHKKGVHPNGEHPDKEHEEKPGEKAQDLKIEAPVNQPLDESTRLKKEIEEKEKEAAANYDKYLRAVADLDNYRKRTERDKGDMLKYGNEKLIKDLLPILDSLDRALVQTGNSSGDINVFTEGIKLIRSQLLAALERHGVEKIKAKGEDFDPHIHQSMLQVETEMETNKIVEEFEAGYLLNGRLLKPARVSVSKKVTDKD
jgi:molecular chaperone GrpE